MIVLCKVRSCQFSSVRYNTKLVEKDMTTVDGCLNANFDYKCTLHAQHRLIRGHEMLFIIMMSSFLAIEKARPIKRPNVKNHLT